MKRLKKWLDLGPPAQEPDDQPIDIEEARLEYAESRAERLLQRAEHLREITVRRDKDNQWSKSIQLWLSGGTS